MTNVNNSQLKMLSQPSHKYGCNNSQDIQLQVIIKDNDNLRRTKIKTSPVSMKKPVTRAQGFTNDDIIKVQYGKIKLNQCGDFRTAPHLNNENSNERVADLSHHPPVNYLSPEKSENKINCFDSTYLCQTLRNFILEKKSERTWKLLKWLMFLLFLCIFIVLIVYTSVNGLNSSPLASKCLNSSTDCTMAIKMNKTESSVNSSIYSENLLQLSQYSQNEEEEYKDVTETIFKGSTTLLRPVIVPQLIQSNFREKGNFENGPKNDYIAIERKQNPVNTEYTASTRKQSSYGPRLVEKVHKTETLNLLGFTSGHQNNFGVPIEEDERVLRLLNEELIKLDHQREPSSVDSQTESSVIVSPTLPLILHEVLESSTISTGQSEEIQCHSTSLSMCRGILQYDLTSSKVQDLPEFVSELSAFEELFASNCSARAAEFVCTTLEPECRPTQIGSLQPCKRICKSILEACSSLIVSSDILTYTFDCDKYPDSNDRNVCEDPTRRRACYENEFKCEDSSCIPSQWQCDNIKDCSDGEDESGCLICNTEEFRCRSNEKCLEDKFRCDSNEDCADGSDERDCDSENDGDDDLQLYPRIFSFASFLLPNFTNENTFTSESDQDRLASGSELNESITSVASKNSNTSSNSTNPQDSKEIMVMSDSEKKLKVSQAGGNGTKEASHTTERPASCIGDQLRCVSGKCITVDQLCDKVMDCPEGEDELMCAYSEKQSPVKTP